jgi:hypothetical protein
MKKMLTVDVLLMIVFFLIWCVLDFMLVRSSEYPKNIYRFDRVFLLMPAVTLASNLWITRRLSRPMAILYSILGVCLALMFAVVTLGICFHLSIGGGL